MPSNSHAQIGTSIATKKIGEKHVLLGTSATESLRLKAIAAGSHAVRNSSGAKYAKRVELKSQRLCFVPRFFFTCMCRERAVHTLWLRSPIANWHAAQDVPDHNVLRAHWDPLSH